MTQEIYTRKFLIHSSSTNKRSLGHIYRLYKSSVPGYNRCTKSKNQRKQLTQNKLRQNNI